MLKKLYGYIKECYGYASKTKIPIVINNDDGEIVGFKGTHDGKEILKAYSSMNKNSYKLKSMLDTVESFEKEYGDGTSLLILLMLDLESTFNEISISDVDEVNYILKDNLCRVHDKFDNEYIRKEWIKTVCRNEVFSEDIGKFLLEDKRIANVFENSNMAWNRMNENNECVCKKTCDCYDDHGYECDYNCACNCMDKRRQELSNVSVINRSGFTIDTWVNPRFASPKFKRSSNCDVFLYYGKTLNSSMFNNIANSIHKRSFVICYNYDEDVENYINSADDCNLVVIRLPINRRYLIDDLDVVLGAKQTGVGETRFGNCKNIIIDEKSVTFTGFTSEKGDIDEYCKNLASIESESGKLAEIELRNKNIVSNNVIDVIITSQSASIRSDIKFMIEDIQRSEHLTRYGYVEGSLKWAESCTNSGNQLVQSILRIKEILDRNLDSPIRMKDPYDLYSCIKNAIIVAVNYHNSEINTISDPINVNFRKYY